METINQLNNFTKTVLVAGLIFILYGYLSRIAGIYFFWESKSIGWAILFTGIISFLAHRIKMKTPEANNTALEKIGIGVIVFVLLIQTILISMIPFTDACSVAKKHIIEGAALHNEIGAIHGFGLIPTGAIQKTINSSGEYGSATINLTVKGDLKFKDITIYVVKYADSPEWKVEGIE
ncbi:MAG: hypothetical protein ACK5XV_07465 [Flavobacteriales bacterium]|jgi:hypothetical protein